MILLLFPITLSFLTASPTLQSNAIRAGEDTLDIQSSEHSKFSDWNAEDFKKTYTLIKTAATYLQHRGLSSWLTYGAASEVPFKWQIVPFNGDAANWIDQIGALWNITFPSERHVQPLNIEPNLLPKSVNKPSLKDFFCDPKVIQKQLIYESNLIYVIYIYAPLGDLHFLLVPKRYVVNFFDLTAEEYVEAELLASKIIHYYSPLNGHLLDKNGVAAGQPVPHWHQHLILTEYAWFGHFQFALRMLMGPSPLDDQTLEERVERIKKSLGSYLVLQSDSE